MKSIDLYNKQELYRQDNSATEMTLKYFNAKISHVLCGPAMLGNLHSIMGWPVDRKVPEYLQLEDYVSQIIWSISDKKAFPPSDPKYYQDAMEIMFGRETTNIDWRHPVPSTLKAYLDSNHAVGVCWNTGGFYHYIVIRGYDSNGDWLIVDSAPDLSGSMLYSIKEDEYKKFSKYMILCKKYKDI